MGNSVWLFTNECGLLPASMMFLEEYSQIMHESDSSNLAYPMGVNVAVE